METTGGGCRSDSTRAGDVPARRLVVHWARLLPYHLARLRGCQSVLGPRGVETAVLETASADDVYANAAVAEVPCLRETVFPGANFHSIPSAEFVAAVGRSLDRLRADLVAVNGYSFDDSRSCLAWCLRNSKPAILMSESWERDARRRRWKEQAKSLFVRQFDAALVGGARHAEYLHSLGMPREQIFFGYDAVDNELIARQAAAAEAEADRWRVVLGLPRPFFLDCARFVPVKNLERLIEAFARYRRMAGGDGWDLVVCGGGPLEESLHRLTADLGLHDAVHFPGFKQYDELSPYYGLAGAFVHVSTVEPWGLVVNEAAAAGLPVVISDACGSAAELVQEGRNGFVVDPLDVDQIARRMHEVATAPADRRKSMSEESRQLAERVSPRRFGEGMLAAVDAALEHRRRRGSTKLAGAALTLSLRAFSYR